MLQLVAASAAATAWTSSLNLTLALASQLNFVFLLLFLRSLFFCVLHAAIISTNVSVTQPEQGCPTQWPARVANCVANCVGQLPALALGIRIWALSQRTNNKSSIKTAAADTTQRYEQAQLNQLLNANSLIFVSPLHWLLDLFITQNRRDEKKTPS